MGSFLTAKVAGSVAALLIGGVVGGVTVYGLVQSQVNGGNSSVNASNPTVDYGSTP